MTITVMIGRNRNGEIEIAEVEEWRLLLLLETSCCWTKYSIFGQYHLFIQGYS